MALISARKLNNKEKIKLEMDTEILSKIQNYCEWAGVSSLEHFIEEAALFVFSKDKEWKKHLKASSK